MTTKTQTQKIRKTTPLKLSSARTSTSTNGLWLTTGEGIPYATPQMVGDPLIDGVVIRLPAAMVWTGANTFNFNQLVAQVQIAVAAGKPVTIDLMFGGFSPDWFSSAGIETLVMQELRAIGSTPPTIDEMPVVWDKVYQGLLQNTFIPAVAKALQPYSDSIVGICITCGQNAKTEEARISIYDWAGLYVIPQNKPVAMQQAWAKWQAAGYTQSKVLAALKKTTAAWAANFPNAKLMAYFITAQAFFDDDGGSNEIITSQYLQWLSDTYGTRVVAAYTYLNSTSKFPEYTPIYGTELNLMVGEQCAQVLFNGTTISDTDMLNTLMPAIKSGIGRIEIYWQQLQQNAVVLSSAQALMSAAVS